MAAKESQEPFSRPVPSQRADEKKGRSPGEQAARARLRLDVPAVQAAEEWQRTFDAVPDLIAILDTQHWIVRVNKAMAERLGLAKDRCVGQTCYGLVHGTDEPLPFCPHSRLLQDGEEHTVEVHEERLAGDFLVTVSPLRDSAGRLVGSVHVARDITERKRADDALRESEERYRTLFAAVSDAAFVIDQETERILDVNQAAVEMYGYSRQQWLTFKTTDVSAEPDKTRDAVRSVPGRIAVQYHKKKNGDVFPVEISLNAFDYKGRPTIVCTTRDITERKQAEETLRASEDKYRNLVETAREGIGIVDPDENIVFVNQAYADMLGSKKEELLGLNLKELTDEAEFSKYVSETRKRRSGESSRYETVLRHKTGEPKHISVSASPLYDDCGRFVGTLGLLTDITERKRAERELRESEARFAELFANMSSGVAVFEAVDAGADFVFKYFNKAAERIECTTREEVIGRRVTEAFPGVKEFGLLDVLQQVWRTGTPQHHPVSAYKDERIAGWRENYVYRLPSGEVVAAYDDVTERKQGEEELCRARDYADSIINSMTDMLLVVLPDGTIGTVNDATCNLLGYAEHELIGQPATLLFEEENTAQSILSMHPLPVKQTVLRRLVKEGSVRNVEKSLLTKSGDRIPVVLSGSVMRDDEDEIRGIVCLALDITQRKQAEDALRASQGQLNAMLASVPNHVSMMDKDLNIVWANDTAKRLFGNDLIGKKCYQAYHGRETPCEPYPCLTLKAFEDERTHTHETQVIDKDAKTHYFHCTANVALRDENGNPTGVIEISQNITEQKRAEKALRRSEKMQAEAEKLVATGRMAARVAHEINGPLAGIKNCFRLIRDAVPEDHPDRDMVEPIEREIDRITHIVRQMYKLHSPRAQTPTDVPVGETIRDVLVMLEPLRREHEVTIELAPVSPKLIVRAPEGSLQQVLYNLTVNAIQASRRSGVVNIVAEPVDKHYVRISIRDQGPGIPAEVQDRMFEPLFSADTGGGNAEGIGLGLSVVRSIVESLEGKIEFESRVGEGTCFHVYLPSKQP